MSNQCQGKPLSQRLQHFFQPWDVVCVPKCIQGLPSHSHLLRELLWHQQQTGRCKDLLRFSMEVLVEASITRNELLGQCQTGTGHKGSLNRVWAKKGAGSILRKDAACAVLLVLWLNPVGLLHLWDLHSSCTICFTTVANCCQLFCAVAAGTSTSAQG